MMVNAVKFTTEQETWLRDNFYNATSYADLTERFNLRFGLTKSKQAISDKCGKKLHLKGMPNLTQYGTKPKEQLPIGTIRKNGGVTFIKTMMHPRKTSINGYDKPYWLPLQMKIYQDAYGKINDNQMVCFLDNNPDNFDLENLYCIDRKVAGIMALNGWWSKDPNITLAAIKWCELHFAIKKVRGD